MRVSINGGTGKWLVYEGKSQLQMDELWAKSRLLRKPPDVKFDDLMVKFQVSRIGECTEI